MVAGLPPRRVLLAVDDDPGVLDAYRAIFQGDYELLTATGGQAALQILQQRSIDVELLDIRMPGGSGLAVLDAMQALTRPPRVVVVSAVNEAHSALAAFRLGAQDYVTKPFDTDELELVVRCLAEDQTPPIRQPGTPEPALPHTLIVSRHLGLRASLAVALRTQGRVDSVPGAEAARGVLARALPDAVVVDVAPGPHDRETLAVVGDQYPAAQIITTDSRHLGSEGRVLEQVTEVLCLRHNGFRRFTHPVLKVVAHVASRYAHSSVEAIADDAALSSRQLGRVFAEQLGMTVKDYVTRVRIEAAKCLLRETTEKEDAVAQMVGFYDATYLARVFRRRGSGPPASYRR